MTGKCFALKSILNEILRGRYKSEEQKSALQNSKWLYEAREAVITLFSDYCLTASEARYKSISWKSIRLGIASQYINF